MGFCKLHDLELEYGIQKYNFKLLENIKFLIKMYKKEQEKSVLVSWGIKATM